MTTENAASFFVQHGKYLSSQQLKKNVALPFKEHAQFPQILDILSRKNKHHVFLQVDFSPYFQFYFIEAFVHYLTHDHIPANLRHADIIYLDNPNIFIPKSGQNAIENDFAQLRESLDKADKYLLFVLPDTELLSPYSNQVEEDHFLKQQINSLLNHPNCRLLIFMTQRDNKSKLRMLDLFDHVSLVNPSHHDILALLKIQRTELETFHHVLIPEEILNYTYSLAERYLSTNKALEKALLLLDSSAARAAATSIEKADNHAQFKPVVTINIVASVLSGWTHIPTNNLVPHKFKYNEFTNHMLLRVFGQDAAITMLGQALQQSQARLQHYPGPFCSLLFAGPAHSGKHTTAIAMVDQLFMQPHTLHVSHKISPSLTSILDLKLQRHKDKLTITLKELIKETPYAVIQINQIEQMPALIMDELHEILRTGHLYDGEGNEYNFKQAIILCCTTLGSHRSKEIANNTSTEQATDDVDLLHLVMSEKKFDAYAAHQITPSELATELGNDIATLLPLPLTDVMHIIPFLPLNKSALEKIIRLELKQLGKTLEAQHSLDLGYAPEVIRFLTNEMLNSDIHHGMKHLYFAIEQALLSQTDNKNRPNQLFLQLNETGHALKCDWLSLTAPRQHAT